MSTPIDEKAAVQQELLDRVREAARLERQVRVEAPIEAKRVAAERIEAATRLKIQAMREARAGAVLPSGQEVPGATLAAIAAQLGIRNLSQVSKMLKNGAPE